VFVAATQCNAYCEVKHDVTDVWAVCLDWLKCKTFKSVAIYG